MMSDLTLLISTDGTHSFMELTPSAESVMPQGTILENPFKSGETFNAKPCIVNHRLQFMPMAASFFAFVAWRLRALIKVLRPSMTVLIESLATALSSPNLSASVSAIMSNSSSGRSAGSSSSLSSRMAFRLAALVGGWLTSALHAPSAHGCTN